MNSIRKKGVLSKSDKLDVQGAKAIFENGMKRQRAPSPAPTSMTAQSPSTKRGASSSNISCYKERFEIFTAPKKDTPKPLLRRASSEGNDINSSIDEDSRSRRRARSNSAAEGHWFQARTKIYEQLSKKRSQSDKDLRSNATKSNTLHDEQQCTRNKYTDGKIVEATSISDRISRYKSDVETKKTNSEKVADQPEKQPVNIKDIKSTLLASEPAHPQIKIKSTSFLEKCKKLGQSITGDLPSTNDAKKEAKKSPPQPKRIKKHIENGSNSSATKSDDNKIILSKNKNEVSTVSGDRGKSANKSINFPKQSQQKVVADITDIATARHFMEELIAAIDNDQHVPMKQLIELFETMKKENGEMKESIDNLKSQLNKTELDSLSKSLEQKLVNTTEELERAKEQIKELSSYSEALRESEERCEELEELNNQYLDEIEELKLVMNEMRDQFHDDEVHETIILQQRLDDMARSLRIIHFRLKKADAKIQETEQDKATLLEEIKLLQGGTFTDEEIRRMQSLEGDLQSAKEISVELHNQLQRSEQRREKLEQESNQLRDEIKAGDLENERLRNNILHLRDQVITY